MLKKEKILKVKIQRYYETSQSLSKKWLFSLSIYVVAERVIELNIGYWYTLKADKLLVKVDVYN